jgi:O-antigen ligase
MRLRERTVALAKRAVASPRARDYLTVWTIVLLMSGQGFRHLLGLPAYTVVGALTVIAVAVMFIASGKKPRVPLLIWAFVGLAAISALWSATRGVTIAAVAILIATTFLAVATVRSASTARFMTLLYRGLQISVFLGLLFEIVVATVVRGPVYPLFGDLARIAGIDETDATITWSENRLFEGGPIQGFVGNRNPFGALALLAAIVAVVLLLEKRIRRTDGMVTLAAAIAVHVLTMSATATVAAMYIGVLTLAAIMIRSVPETIKRTVSFGVLACTAVAGVLTLKFREEIFAMFDRGSDATHRIDIWNQVILFAEQRPEGWGFVGYWPVWEEPYASINANTGIVATHAHNAFLDTWFQMGIIGLALLVVIIVLLFGSAWRLVERASQGDTFVPLGWALLTAALALQALTESRLLVEGGWFLLVVLYCSGPQVFTLTMVDPDVVHTGAPAPPAPVSGDIVVDREDTVGPHVTDLDGPAVAQRAPDPT